ncbi:MAG: polysaccharide deacetylase family protein [Ruminococcus sp.]|nr:polysaccharide deacetylase family protein [Ruminococcus sp.]
MKKLAVILAALMLCGCTSSDKAESRADDSSGFMSILGEAFKETVDSLIFSNDYSQLSTEKHGYGQGVQLDNENRPAGAIDFNNVYSKYNATAIGSADKKEIRLTFDQGYENGFTAGILDTLKEKCVKATFFVLDDYARRNPELVRRMIDEGHTVGNHSVSHYSMPTLTPSECVEEIMGLHKYIKDEFGYEMTEFRPPMGEFSEQSLAVTNDCGYRTVLWSYAYADWDVNAQPEPASALKKLTGALHSGAIYLLHSVSETNAKILGDFIDEALAQGYTFI